MTNRIYKAVTERLADPKGRFVVQVAQSGCASKVYGPADLGKIKAEGSGLRIGRLFIFECQVRLAYVK